MRINHYDKINDQKSAVKEFNKILSLPEVINQESPNLESSNLGDIFRLIIICLFLVCSFSIVYGILKNIKNIFLKGFLFSLFLIIILFICLIINYIF